MAVANSPLSASAGHVMRHMLRVLARLWMASWKRCKTGIKHAQQTLCM
jgi:hypothetical protein